MTLSLLNDYIYPKVCTLCQNAKGEIKSSLFESNKLHLASKIDHMLYRIKNSYLRKKLISNYTGYSFNIFVICSPQSIKLDNL